MMNTDQQKTVNELIKAMELDTYGEKGLKEIIRQSVVEIVKRSAPPKREPLSDYATYDMFRASKQAVTASCYWAGIRDAEKAHGIGVDDETV